MPTDRRYTGQREVADLGLYDYNARYYDPYIGRFIQADTIIPTATNSQDFNRYSYVLNNPLRNNDPSGHSPGSVIALVIAALALDHVTYFYLVNKHDSRNVRENQLMPVYRQSTSDAQFLSDLFTSDLVKGNTARGRMRRILRGTHQWPGGFMEGEFGVSGFNDSVSDAEYYEGNNPDGERDWYWEGASDQVGHFLTAAGWGWKDAGWGGLGVHGNQNSQIYGGHLKRLAVGHELLTDKDLIGQILVSQFGKGIGLFNQALNAFAAGEENWDAPLEELYNLGTGEQRDRIGNSIQDLRCTVIGWQFGRLVRQNYFSTRQEAADWLKKYLQ